MSGSGLDVAVVTPRYPPISSGGGERSAQLLATQLADSDRVGDVTVFSFDGDGETTDSAVRIRRLGRVSSAVTELQNVRAAAKLADRITAFDVVHGYNMELHPTVGYLSRRYDVPSVATLNSYHFFPKSVTNTTPGRVERLYELVGHPTTGRLMLRAMRHVDAFVALSRSIGRIYRENGFDGCRIEYVQNMIDPSFEVPYADPTDGYTLLYVGTLTENKGVEYLVRALPELSDEYRLRVVGDGDRAEFLRSLAERCGVADRTEFTGRISYERIGAEYAKADLFVHPGIWPEPLNRTLLEAMQAGLPVVCTDIGGPPEVVPDEEYICPPRDPSALAETIAYAREADDDAGSRNRQYVLEHHSPSVVVPEIVDLYEDLLGG